MTPRREASVFVLLLVLLGAAVLTAPRDGSERVLLLHGVMALFLAVHAVAAAVAALRGSVSVRVAVAVSLLLGSAAVAVAWLAGFRLPYLLVIEDWRHAAISAGTSLLAALGLARRHHWARWLALGLGVAGMMGGALNVGAFLLDHVWWEAVRPLLVSLFFGALLAATVAGPGMRDAFLKRRGGELWASPHRVVTSVRWAIVANLAAAPMLLIYAWTQPVVPSTVLTSEILAVLLVVAVALAAMRKVVGALLLVVGGVGLAVQTAALLWLAHRDTGVDPEIVHYYAAFWTPASLLSLVAGATLARPVVALLRT